MIEFNE
jgi:hypothetical protein